MTEGNVLTYIAGYLADKFKNSPNLCQECSESLAGPSLEYDDEMFLKGKRFGSKGETEGLAIPSKALKNNITKFESI